MTESERVLPLFPLDQVVLYPGMSLPLRIFESRYVDMVGGCMRQDAMFGVVLIVDGNDTSSVVSIAEVGTSARIVDFQTQPDGLLGLLCRGERRFRVGQRRQQTDGLNRATVEWIDDAPLTPLDPQFAPLVSVLRKVMARLESIGRFIEPNYGTFPWDKVSQNDQHPLSDVFRGEKLIWDVYNALRTNDALWQRSLLVITYDEHGGFYDHVDPPAAVRPDNRTDASGFKFDRLGLRVPTILLSPWLDQGVINDTFDHTSLLKFLIDKWRLTNLLGERVASASTNTFAKYLRKTPRPTYNLLPKSNIPTLHATPESTELSDNQKSMIELGHHLAAQISDTNVRTAMMARSMARTPRDEAQLAVEQFRSFMIDRAKHPIKPKPLPTKKKARTKAAVKATKAVKARKSAKRRAKK